MAYRDADGKIHTGSDPRSGPNKAIQRINEKLAAIDKRLAKVEKFLLKSDGGENG